MDIQPQLNVVLGTAHAPGGTYMTTPAGTNHTIDVSVPAGKHVVAAWYVPIDNLPDLSAFSTIQLTPISPTSINLSLKQANAAREGLLRILIYYATS